MLGMNFTSFLMLLVVSVVIAAVYHWILRYRFLEGIDLSSRRLRWARSEAAGLAGTGTLVMEDPQRLPGIGDSGRNRLYSLQRAALADFRQALGRRARSRGGDPTQACGMNGRTVLQREANKCNVNRLAAIFVGSREFHRNTRLKLKASIGTPVWNAPDSLTPRVGTVSYSEA